VLVPANSFLVPANIFLQKALVLDTPDSQPGITIESIRSIMTLQTAKAFKITIGSCYKASILGYSRGILMAQCAL